VDIFIEAEPAVRFNAFDLIDVKTILERRLAAHFDLTTREGLHPRLRDRIEREAVRSSHRSRGYARRDRSHCRRDRPPAWAISEAGARHFRVAGRLSFCFFGWVHPHRGQIEAVFAYLAERQEWADSAPTGVASGRTALEQKAGILLQAPNGLQGPKSEFIGQ
jgi:hypothetical protein